MTGKIVECYYTLSSPWAYFAGPRFEALLLRHRARADLKPYDFQQVVQQNGGVPLRTRPQARQDYHAVELDRWRRHLGMPLNLKPRFYPPVDNLSAGHTVIAAQQRGLDALRLSHAILRATWAEERDVAQPEVRAAICDENGMPGAELVAAEKSEPVTAEYRRNTEEVAAKGVFGSPTYVFRGELFWGQDRLDFLDRAMALDGWEPTRPAIARGAY
ncbi:MAG: 2-hydroxychromene-2-carboxylate isomerase [Acetobacterales bacterium]